MTNGGLIIGLIIGNIVQSLVAKVNTCAPDFFSCRATKEGSYESYIQIYLGVNVRTFKSTVSSVSCVKLWGHG